MPRRHVKHPYSRSEHSSSHQSKKLKLLTASATTSPFPDHLHPTPAECHAVFNLIAIAPTSPLTLATENSAATCGATSDVLDALIGTILAQHTTSANASRAKSSLAAAFPSWTALAAAPRPAVVAALSCGGLANRKAAAVQSVLATAYARHGVYSLQHLTAPGAAPMEELLGYPGVGPKTAACVCAFALGHAVFAVDTHVARLCKTLGWVPEYADRVRAQAHLQVRVPAELRRGLHVGMVRHGQACKACRAGARSDNGKVVCILRDWIIKKKEEGKESSGGVEVVAEPVVGRGSM